jgi:hypothetical protein
LKIQPSLDFTKISPAQGALDAFVSMLQKVYRNLGFVVNGHISFGDGSNADNIDGVWVAITTGATPDTDFTVDHNLGRVPVGYSVARRALAVDVYDGSGGVGAWTNSQMILRATIPGISVLLFVY